MKNQFKNKKGGFLELIILIIAIVFLLSYFHITISVAWDWLVGIFKSVFS